MTSVLGKLRPAKVNSAIRRRHFEWRLGRLPIEAGPEIVELGSAYGGWKVPEETLSDGQICYCIGSGGDISFDLELIRRYGALVRAVDPVDTYEEYALEAAAGEPRFTFRRFAVTTRDGAVRMQTHHQAESESLSGAGLYDTDTWVEVEGRTIESLMQELGDTQIDLLKLDVEGTEYELVPTLDLVALGVTIFAVQLHHTGTAAQALGLVDAVRRQGYRLVAQRPVVKLTFCRAAG
jgi:FkbM family methyltransferase